MMGPDQHVLGESRPSVRMDLILTQPAFLRVLEALPSVKMEAPSLVLMEQTWDSSPTLLDEHCDYLKKISLSISTYQLKLEGCRLQGERTLAVNGNISG